MLCRLVLTAVAVSCTFSREVTARIQNAQQIKDLACMLWLSGLQKDDLDVNMLRKLQRHNVNIDDMNNETLRQECLYNGNTTKNITETNNHTNIWGSRKNDNEINADKAYPSKVKNNINDEIVKVLMQERMANKEFSNTKEQDKKESSTEENITNSNIKQIDKRMESTAEKLPEDKNDIAQSILQFWQGLAKSNSGKNNIKDNSVLNNKFIKEYNVPVKTTPTNEYMKQFLAKYISENSITFSTTTKMPETLKESIQNNIGQKTQNPYTAANINMDDKINSEINKFKQHMLQLYNTRENVKQSDVRKKNENIVLNEPEDTFNIQYNMPSKIPYYNSNNGQFLEIETKSNEIVNGKQKEQVPLVNTNTNIGQTYEIEQPIKYEIVNGKLKFKDQVAVTNPSAKVEQTFEIDQPIECEIVNGKLKIQDRKPVITSNSKNGQLFESSKKYEIVNGKLKVKNQISVINPNTKVEQTFRTEQPKNYEIVNGKLKFRDRMPETLNTNNEMFEIDPSKKYEIVNGKLKIEDQIPIVNLNSNAGQSFGTNQPQKYEIVNGKLKIQDRITVITPNINNGQTFEIDPAKKYEIINGQIKIKNKITSVSLNINDGQTFAIDKPKKYENANNKLTMQDRTPETNNGQTFEIDPEKQYEIVNGNLHITNQVVNPNTNAGQTFNIPQSKKYETVNEKLKPQDPVVTPNINNGQTFEIDPAKKYEIVNGTLKIKDQISDFNVRQTSEIDPPKKYEIVNDKIKIQNRMPVLNNTNIGQTFAIDQPKKYDIINAGQKNQDQPVIHTSTIVGQSLQIEKPNSKNYRMAKGNLKIQEIIPIISKDVIREIADNIKTLVLKDLRQEINWAVNSNNSTSTSTTQATTLLDTTTTTMTTTISHNKYTEVTTSINPQNQNDDTNEMMKKILKLMEQVKSTTESVERVKSTIESVIIAEDTKIPMVHKKREFMDIMKKVPPFNTFSVASQSTKTQNIVDLSNVQQNRNIPTFLTMTPQEKSMIQSPLLLQTNSREIAPIAISLPKHRDVINQVLLVKNTKPPPTLETTAAPKPVYTDITNSNTKYKESYISRDNNNDFKNYYYQTDETYKEDPIQKYTSDNDDYSIQKFIDPRNKMVNINSGKNKLARDHFISSKFENAGPKLNLIPNMNRVKEFVIPRDELNLDNPRLHDNFKMDSTRQHNYFKEGKARQSHNLNMDKARQRDHFRVDKTLQDNFNMDRTRQPSNFNVVNAQREYINLDKTRQHNYNLDSTRQRDNFNIDRIRHYNKFNMDKIRQHHNSNVENTQRNNFNLDKARQSDDFNIDYARQHNNFNMGKIRQHNYLNVDRQRQLGYLNEDNKATHDNFNMDSIRQRENIENTGEGDVKGFHEKLERNSDISQNRDEHLDNDYRARLLLPIDKIKAMSRYDKHFSNFMKTQEKVNDMLEKILETKTIGNSPMSDTISMRV